LQGPQIDTGALDDARYVCNLDFVIWSETVVSEPHHVPCGHVQRTRTADHFHPRASADGTTTHHSDQEHEREQSLVGCCSLHRVYPPSVLRTTIVPRIVKECPGKV